MHFVHIVCFNSLLSLTIYFNINGTATNGVDNDLIPDSVVIPAGQKSVDLQILAYFDNIVEGTETIIITIPPDLNNATCIDDIESEVTVNIINTDPMSVTAGANPDTDKEGKYIIKLGTDIFIIFL